MTSPLARCLMDAATRRAGKCWCCGKEHGLTQVQTAFGLRLTCAGCEPRLDVE